MIESDAVKVIHQINGQTTFAFNLPFLEAENIHCSVNDNGLERPLAAGVDFAVEVKEDYSQGANITLLLDVTTLADDADLIIYRIIEPVQKSDFREGSKLRMQELENAFDRLTMICQQFKEQLARALMLPADSKEDPQEYISKLMRIAEDAIAAANSATDSADRALQAVASLDQKIADAENAIDTYTDNAARLAQERIAESQTAAENSIAALTEEKKTELAGIASDANDAANSAAGSAQAAFASANSADGSAADAANFAAAAAGSASSAASSADRAAAAAETAAGEVTAAKNELAAELKDYVDNSITNGEW